MSENRAKLTSAARAALPDSAFAFIEPGHDGDKVNGKTPDKWRHYPLHDANHVRDALSRIAQGTKFASQAKPKIVAAARRHGIQHDENSDTGRSLESLFPEVRFIADKPELRRAESADGRTERHIAGYAAVFTKPDGSPAFSRRLGGFVERVMPSAFDEALRTLDQNNVVCRYNHKDDMVLGTTMADTLRLSTDKRGLQYDVIPPEHRGDVMELVDRGDVRYSSFAFRCPVPGEDDEWTESDWQFPLRSLHKVELVDVAPVLDPAYHDTTAVARSITGAVESLASWLDADPSEVRSMLEAGQAKRFFRRTDKRLPKLDRPTSAEREESRVLDDPAISLRRWRYSDEADDQWTDPDERVAPDADELRAAMKSLSHEQLCQKWVQGEPCVRPDGHDGDHAPLCYARKSGLPCHKPMGHDEDHEPMQVKTRDGEDEDTETRSAPDSTSGLSVVEALATLAKTRQRLTQLPD